MGKTIKTYTATDSSGGIPIWDDGKTKSSRLRKLGWFLIGAGVALIAMWFLLFSGITKVRAVASNKVTICHATDSNSNPYVTNQPNKNGNVDGHNGHNGPIWFPGIDEKWGDIIPPFDYGDGQHYPGKNWTTLGQQILGNDCKIPYHNACNEDNACARVEGSGDNTCKHDSDCKPKFHYACNEDKACAKVEGAGENTCESSEDCQGTPTPTPTPTPPPSDNNSGGGGSSGGSTSAPSCPDGNTVKTVANLFVERHGVSATVNFFITEGNSANIYYKVNGQDGWQYSVIDVTGNQDKFVSYTVNDLDPRLGYTFGVQQKFGCGGGLVQTVDAVVIDSNAPATFAVSYYQWHF